MKVITAVHHREEVPGSQNRSGTVQDPSRDHRAVMLNQRILISSPSNGQGRQQSFHVPLILLLYLSLL